MTEQAREKILKNLKSAPRVKTEPRPSLPPLLERSLDGEELVARFSENLSEQTGVLHRVGNADEAKSKLADIAEREHLTAIMASTDPVIAPLHLADWGRKLGITVWTAKDFADRENYRQAVFSGVKAGVTGVDFAVAESGTLCLIHDPDQPRLISIAPALHIALLPIARLLPVYEDVADRVYSRRCKLPGHLTLITGPSMTADIQGGPFRGMHGPGKLVVILIG